MLQNDSTNFDDVMKLQKSEAIDQYGAPYKEEQFILSDLLGEFRIGLFNIYSKEERLKENILMEEVTWEKDKDTWLTVWYQIEEGDGIPKDTLSWDKGSEF